MKRVNDMKKNKVYIMAFLVICLWLTACNKNMDYNYEMIDEVSIDSISPQVTVVPIITPQRSEIITDKTTDIEEDTLSTIPVVEQVDYSNYFEGIQGCAIFLESNSDTYYIYNEELSTKRSSPCSTFKIISTLMGLEKGIVSSTNSKMGYDNTLYTMESWNQDLGLKEAFKESCIWYFRKLIDLVGPTEVLEYLNRLEYGNTDISEWNGSGVNGLPQTNGFWLESSLQISPMEQIQVLENIFGNNTNFLETNIDLLKEVMFVQELGEYSVYGKTGTGRDRNTNKRNNGWFIGMIENTDKLYYYAIHLTDEQQEVSGPKAKEIALNIIEEYYVD